jgi:hypothetical protein
VLSATRVVLGHFGTSALRINERNPTRERAHDCVITPLAGARVHSEARGGERVEMHDSREFHLLPKNLLFVRIAAFGLPLPERHIMLVIAKSIRLTSDRRKGRRCDRLSGRDECVSCRTRVHHECG